VEIWDYKAQKFPDPDRPDELKRFDFQMNVYAELYKLRTGFYPEKAIVYFMNELDPNAPPDGRPRNAYHEVPFDPTKIADALADFETTVAEIEKCAHANSWSAPLPDWRDDDTCDICDFRWSCPPGKKGAYAPRFP
jgi:putative RecB family exonuclease